MATFDFRILLETVEGRKTSYMSQSFVDTSTDADGLVLSASQVYNRITGSVSCSYQNQTIFSGSNFNNNKTFKDTTLLSASLSGSENTGSIVFTALDTEYDRLLRYKFFGEKVCNTLGLPHSQWIYVDQFRLPTDDEANVFQGNIDANTAFISDTLTFANNANINSDVPFYIDTGSDRYIKFIDTRGTAQTSLIFGYDKDTDTYEINASTGSVFNIKNLNNLEVDTINAAVLNHVTSSTSSTLNSSLNNLAVTGSLIVSGTGGANVIGNISASGGISGSGLRINGKSVFDDDMVVNGNVTMNSFTTNQINVSQGSNEFGETNSNVHFFSGSVKIQHTGSNNIGLHLTGSNALIEGNITASGDISSSGNISAGGHVFADGDFRGSTVRGDTQLFLVNNDGIGIRVADSTGNLGVGNTGATPPKTLTVKGDISASGDLDLDGKSLFQGSITASSDISSSGTITAATLDAIAVTDDLAAAIVSEIDNNEIPIAKLAEDAVTVTAGTGLTGGGTYTLGQNKTINVVGGDGITANADDIAVTADQTTITSVKNTSLEVGRDDDNLIDFGTDNKIIFKVEGVNDLELIQDSLKPISSNGIALGTSTSHWSDLFLASGGVINFNNGDVTITHAANSLTIAGGNITASNISAVSMSGDGSTLTGITSEWDGTLTTSSLAAGQHAAQITGSLTLTNDITASGIISTSGMIISHGGTAITFNRAGHEQVTIGQGNSDRFFIRNTNDDRNDLVILDNGNFGIGGNDAPPKTLSVTGDISASGNIITAKNVLVSGSILSIGPISSSGNITGSEIKGEFITAPSASIANLTTTNITASGNISSSGTGTFNKLEIHNDSPLLDLKDTSDDDDHKIRFLDNSANVDYQIDTTDDIFTIRAIANNPIAFFTNNTERVRILNDGNVGIGTDSPLASGLEVRGELGIHDGSGTVHTQLIRETGTGGITFKRVSNSDGSDSGGEFIKAKFNEFIVTGNISASVDGIFGGDITASGNISSSGTITGEKLFIDDDIFIGSSTAGTAPTAATRSIRFGAHENDDIFIQGYHSAHNNGSHLRLAVRDDGSDSIRIETVGFSGDRVDQRGNIKIKGGSITNTINGDTADSFNVQFERSSSVGSVRQFTSSLFVSSSGQVGIGDTAPNQKLVVEDISAGEAKVLAVRNNLANDTTSDSVSIQFSPDNRQDNAARIIVGKDADFSTSANRDTNMQFVVIRNNASKEVMRLTSDERVGIGTNPHEKLHLKQGNLRIETAGDAAQSIKFTEDDTERARIEFDSHDDRNDISIQTTDVSDALQDRLVVKTSQNLSQVSVATNTPAPNMEFTVAGNISASKQFLLQGSASIGHPSVTAPTEGLYVKGNISASSDLFVKGNISASGNLTGSDVQGETLTANVFLSSPSASLTNITTTNITASANISSSLTGSFGAGHIDNKLGIGTTTPSNALHISTGSGNNLTPALRLNKLVDDDGSDGGTATGILMGAVNVGSAKTGIFSENAGAGNGRQNLIFAMDSTADNSDANLSDERMRITHDGKVGIGTTSPDEKLDVNGKIVITSGSTVGDYVTTNFALRKGSSGEGILDAPGHILLNIDTNDNNTDRYFGITKNAGTEIFRVQEDGNVGIGDTDPPQALSIVGNILLQPNAENDSFIHGNNDLAISSDAGVLIVSDTNQTTGNAASDIIFGAGSAVDTNSNKDFTFAQAYPSVVPRLEAMRIKGDTQNVGIGTTSPSEKLHINDGNIMIDGNITTPSFTSGFAGNGYRIESGSDGKTSMILDDLTVRGTMNVYELLINQVRATNGSLFVSSTGKVDTISGSLDDVTLFGTTSGSSFLTNYPTASNRLLVHYTFNDGGKTPIQDYSGNANTGSASLSTNLETADGYFGKGAEFVSSSHDTITLPSSVGGTTLQHFTFAMWVKRDKSIDASPSSGSVGFQRLIGSTTSANIPIIIESDNDITFRIPGVKSDFEDEDPGRTHFNDANVPSGSWTHLVCTYNQATSSVYIDGQLKGTGALGAGTVDFGTHLVIGAGVGSNLNNFDGMVDDFRLYTGSLSATEVEALYSGSEGIVLTTGDNTNHGFDEGDVIRAQRFTGTGTFKSDMIVTRVDSETKFAVEPHSSVKPEEGFEYVRLGNTFDTDRQGAVYITADDDDAPFIDIVDGITKHSEFNTTGKVKTRMGKLSGITSPRFGTLSGFGFYASGSAFLEGSINATDGAIGGFGITKTEISSSDGSKLRLKSSGQITGSEVLFTGGKIAGFTIDGHSLTTAGVEINDSTQPIFISSSAFNVSHGGDVTASNVDLSGKITATSGEIGGFTIDSDEIKSTNLLLDSNNEKITVGSANALTIQGGGTDNFITMGNKTTFGQSTNVGAIFGMDNTVPTLELFKDANNKFIFNNSGLEINTNTATISGSNVQLITPKFFFGTSTDFISSSESGIKISTGEAVISGSNVEIQTPSFMFGDKGTSFISSSTSQIEISSSAFHLQNNGQVTGSNVLFDGGKVGGFAIDNEHISSNNLVLDSAANNGEIRLNTTNLSTGNGFYANGNGSFRVGNADGQLIKFAGGVLTISSSALDLDSDGNLTISGTISSSVGNIGGFTIGKNFISSSNLIISSSTGDDFLISASSFNVKANGQLTASNVSMSGNITAQSGEIGGFTIDAHSLTTTGVEINDSTQTTFINTNAFKVDHSGNITASNVDLTGKITATTGEIGGFDIGGDLSATNFTLDPSGKRITLGTGDTIFIADGDEGIQLGDATFADAPFSVTTGGVLKSTSGTIGGFTINNTSISSSNRALILSSSGIISGSDVHFNGGKIGGFIIGANKISSSNLVLSSSITPTDEIISASNFQVKASGQLTASRFLFTGGNIKGDVTMSDNVRIEGGLQVGAFPEMPSDANLIGYWAFDEEEGTLCLDNSGNGNSGSFIGPPKRISGSSSDFGAQSTGSVVGNSILFDGNGDVIQITSSALPDEHLAEGDFSITAWINPNQSIDEHDIIVSKRDRQGDGFQFDLREQFETKGSNDLPFSLGFAFDSNNDGVGAITTVEGSKIINSGSWTHVAVTVDRDDRIKLYVNGEFDRQSGNISGVTSAVTGSPTDNPPLCIGGKLTFDGDSTVDQPFDGYIDEVRIYDNVLAENEIRALYLNPAGTGRTKISGDTISTGKITSNNLTVSGGSEFNLNDGTFKLGGTEASNLSFDGTTLEVSGTLSSSIGNIGGFTLAKTSISSPFLILSSSTGNAEIISASNFNVKANGQVTASNTLFENGIFSGSITSQATMSGGTIVTDTGDTRVEIDGVANELKFIQGGSETVRIGQLDASTGRSGTDEFGLLINNAEAKINVTRTGTDFSGVGDLNASGQAQFSTMERTAGIKSKFTVSTDTNENKDGAASILGIMDVDSSVTFNDSGIFAGVVGRTTQLGVRQYRSAGVVGMNSSSCAGDTTDYFGAVPIDSYGVVSIGNTLVSGSLQLFGDNANLVVSGGAIIGTENEDNLPNTLNVYHNGADGDNGIMIVRDDTSTNTNNILGGIGFDSTDGNVPSTILEASAYIAGFASEPHSTGDKGGYLTFGTAQTNQDDDTTTGERMRLKNDGTLLIGRTSALSTNKDPLVEIDGTIAFDGFISRAGTGGSDNGNHVINFNWDGDNLEAYVATTFLFEIEADFSDYRIKDNVTPMEDGVLDKINKIKPIHYTQKAYKDVLYENTGSIKTSIIAHELQEIFPDLVVGEKDAVQEDGTPELQRFKDKDLTIYLVKAVQELSQKVDSLEAQLSGSR